MRVVRVDKQEQVSSYLAKIIRQKLAQGQKVLWLLSGGSAIGIAVSARQQIDSSPNLVIGLIDERYGEVGHDDSNWEQLVRAGLNLDGVQIIQVLNGQDLDGTVNTYSEKIGLALAGSDYVIGLLGMGIDGHTGGILPGSSAVNEVERYVMCYQGPDYLRITTTPKLISQLDEAVLYVAGEAKKPVIEMLVNDTIPPMQQPAQLLKAAKQFTIYTDQLGDKLPGVKV